MSALLHKYKAPLLKTFWRRFWHKRNLTKGLKLNEENPSSTYVPQGGANQSADTKKRVQTTGHLCLKIY